MSHDIIIALVGAAIGWFVRGFVMRWIIRATTSQATRDAMGKDIDRTVAHWMHRK